MLTVGPAAHGAAGDLDATFAGDGRVAFPGAGPFVARAAAIDGGNRVVVAGYSCEPNSTSQDGTCLADGNSSFRLARLTPDGGLDAEFGQNGFVTTPVGEGRSQALDVLLLPDGGIVAGGVATVNGTDVFALVRYGADGAVDAGFGANGQVLQPIGADYAAVADLALGPNGTVLAAGQAVDSAGQPRMAVARFTSTGALDSTFGHSGSFLGGNTPYGYGLSVAMWGDGSVIAGGIAGDNATAATYRFGMLRLTPTGLPDPTFGINGAAEHRIGAASSFANSMLALPGGAWVAGGAAIGADGAQAMAVTRGLGSGALDQSFGTGGSTLLKIFEGAVANDLVLYPDGRVGAVGQAQQGGTYVFAQARLLQNGAPDQTFGGGGLSGTGFDRYPVARATAGALQADGRLVSVGIGCGDGGTGTRCAGGTSVLLVTRQLGDPPVTPTPTPTPTPDTTPPTISVRVPKQVGRRELRRNGTEVKVTLNEPGRLQASLSRPRPGRRSGRVLIDRALRRELRASHTLRLKGRTRRGAIRLTIRATDAAGNAMSRRFTIRVR